MGPAEECSSGTILVGHSGEEATYSTGIKQGFESFSYYPDSDHFDTDSPECTYNSSDNSILELRSHFVKTVQRIFFAIFEGSESVAFCIFFPLR